MRFFAGKATTGRACLPSTKILHLRRVLSLSGRFEKEKFNFSARWEVDAVVFGDEADGGRGEVSGEGADTHRSENRTAGGEVTLEGAI